MKRGLVAVAGLLALGLIAPACSTIGDPGGMPEALPHGGTGAFRVLEAPEETGLRGTPGAALLLLEDAFVGAMVQGDFVFFTSAPPVEEPLPMVPEDHPAGEIFWPAFEARRIHRGARRDDGFGAFDGGGAILTAEAAWEGEEVFDPWVVEDGGVARLYYAADGGIGVAEAPSLDGAFTRVGDGPVLGPEAAATGAPTRPSVVRGPEGDWLMYYDAGGEIRVARSSDGLAFTPLGPITVEGMDLGESPELERAHPGALAVTTPAGRPLVRLYFESIREDGAHKLYVAGSFDGVAFERHEVELLESVDLRYPAPVALDERVTLLYASTRFNSVGRITRGLQKRALIVSVAPLSTSFLPPEEDEAE